MQAKEVSCKHEITQNYFPNYALLQLTMEPMEDCIASPSVTDEVLQPKSVASKMGRMVLSPITEEDYIVSYWPQLDNAVKHLLRTKPCEYIPISYEQMYTCVYKCVCKHFAERLYSDLIFTITMHLEQVHSELQQCYQAHNATLYVETFNESLSQYLHALKAIVPIFNYLNRFYIESKLKTDLSRILIGLFVEIIANKQIGVLIPVLMDVNLRPFSVSPVVMSTLMRNLHLIQPEYIQLRPQLFAKYIPNVLPACSYNDLEHYIQEAQQMQRDLLTHPDFISGDQSRKRHNDEDHTAVPMSSSLPADYSS